MARGLKKITSIVVCLSIGDSKKPLDKFYYWRADYFTSIEGAMRSIDRHYKLYKKLKDAN